jgi:BCD family chlorophyll transporter-like MFS transporter
MAGTLPQTGGGPALAYDTVYSLELVLLLATLATMVPLLRPVGLYRGARQLS